MEHAHQQRILSVVAQFLQCEFAFGYLRKQAGGVLRDYPVFEYMIEAGITCTEITVYANVATISRKRS